MIIEVISVEPSTTKNNIKITKGLTMARITPRLEGQNKNSNAVIVASPPIKNKEPAIGFNKSVGNFKYTANPPKTREKKKKNKKRLKRKKTNRKF